MEKDQNVKHSSDQQEKKFAEENTKIINAGAGGFAVALLVKNALKGNRIAIAGLPGVYLTKENLAPEILEAERQKQSQNEKKDNV